jgi:hypothetical protein
VRYDLDVVEDLCRESGLAVHRASDQRVEIDLGEGAVLCFQNSDNERDCLIGFLGMPWHVHDNLGFYGAHGHYIEIDYLDLLVGLKEGKILICEVCIDSRIIDRYLIHSLYNDEFKYLQEGEKIIVRRIIAHFAKESA